MSEKACWPLKLTAWYRSVRREYPWRQDPQPYTVWISEIMLQQTRIEAVLGYYERFMAAFPTVEALAAADEAAVLKLWEGLGYYSRARNLHKAARVICEQYDGHFPETYEAIRALPGIGDYTAGAIAAIALGQPRTAIDGNVMRVTARIAAVEEDILRATTRKKVQAILEAVYPEDQASDFVQGLMELGEQICIPGTPRCDSCPVQDSCRALTEGRTEQLPVRKKKEAPRRKDRLVVMIKQGDAVLLHRRSAESGVLAGLWEYPGVDGSDPSRMEEYFAEQLGLALRPVRHCMDAEHVFSHLRWCMKVYEAELTGPVPAEGFCWATKQQLQEEIMLPTAFKKIKETLL